MVRIILKQFKRILIHKWWVMYYCFQVGLYWQGLVHDLSKFSWTEFSRSIKYYDDKISALANEKKLNGYSETFLHHRGRNPHHYEYWIHSLDDGGVPVEMPEKYAIELCCDYLAACRTYGGDIKTEYQWFQNLKDKIKMHDNTKEFCERVFKYISWGESLPVAVAWAKRKHCYC